MKHTKGKWEASISRGVWIVESVNNNNECSPICTMDDFDGEAVDKANANLIASAPATLIALNEINDLELDGGFSNYETALRDWAKKVGRIAREAIAKAEAS